MPIFSVFVSSTFQDFQSELDLLRGPIQDQLNGFLEPYGCRVAMVDLRWGVDTADVASDRVRHERVLDVCLAEIDRCRPFFVGLLGARAGWLPPQDRVRTVAAAAGLDLKRDVVSMTALEFEYGLRGASGSDAVFFARTIQGSVPPGWIDDDPSRVLNLRQILPDDRVVPYRAVADGHRITDLADFKDLVMRHLGQRLIAAAQESGQNDPYSAAEDLFIAEHLNCFVDDSQLVPRVLQLLDRGVHVCLAGPSGVGKSALWSACVARLRSVDRRVVTHAISLVPDDSSHDAVVRRLIVGFGGIVPTFHRPVLAERVLYAALRGAGLGGRPEAVVGEELLSSWHRAIAVARPCTLAIDGLDRLEVGDDRVRLDLLRQIPSQVATLVSTSDDPQTRVLEARGFTIIRLSELGPDSVARAAGAIATSAHKQLSAGVTSILKAQPRSPLWIHLAIDRLSLLGEEHFSTVATTQSPEQLLLEVAADLPARLADLISRFLRRAERKTGVEKARLYLASLAYSEYGLTPSDLVHTTECDHLEIAELNQSLSLIIARSGEGRTTFRNKAVQQSLVVALSDLQDTVRSRIMDYLHTVSARSPVEDLELLHQCLYLPTLAPPVLAGLLPVWRAGLPSRETAINVAINAIIQQRPETNALDALADGLVYEQKHAPSVKLRVRLLAGKQAPPVRDFIDDIPRFAVGRLTSTERDALTSMVDADDSHQRQPTGRTRRHRLGWAQERIKQVVRIAETEGTEQAQILLQESLAEARSVASRTKFPGPHEDVVALLLVSAIFAAEYGDPAKADELYLDVLERSEYLSVDLAHEKTVHILAAHAGLADIALKRGNQKSALEHYDQGISISSAVIASWSQGDHDRQGILFTRQSLLKMRIENLANTEFDTLATLRGFYMNALGSRIVLALDLGDHATVQDRYRLLVVALESDRLASPLDRDAAIARSQILARIADAAQRTSSFDVAWESYELFLMQLRPLAAEPEVEDDPLLLSYGLARLGSLAPRQANPASANHRYRTIRDSIYEMSSSKGHLVDLAHAFNSVALEETESGNWAIALVSASEAVTIQRGLAATAPDQSLPDLADYLSNMARCQCDQGDSAGALATIAESVAIRRALAALHPQLFLGGLAVALGNQREYSGNVGDHAMALEASKESVEIRRQLANVDPDGFLPIVALALHNLAIEQSENGDEQGALASISEAVGIRRELAEAEPDEYLVSLALSLTSLSVYQKNLGAGASAVSAISEAVAICRRLAVDHPEVGLPQLGLTLSYLSDQQYAVGDRDGALRSISEAVDIRRGLAGSRREEFLGELADLLVRLSSRRDDDGDGGGAIAAVSEAIEVRRELALDRPAVFRAKLANALVRSATLRRAAGDRPGALAAGEEAIVNLRELAKAEPDAYLLDLAGELNDLAIVQRAEEDWSGALATATECVEVCRRLVARKPGTSRWALASSLHTLSLDQVHRGDMASAVASVSEAVRIRRVLAVAQPGRFLPDLANSLRVLSDIFGENGDTDAARACAAELAGVERRLAVAN